MAPILNDDGMDLLFREARSFDSWRDRPVSDVTLMALYDLMRWGPTSANCSPTRILFLRSDQAKSRLRPALSKANVAKTLTAPVCALLAFDTRFYEALPRLFPQSPDARSWFDSNEPKARETAFRNASLQGGYFILAARALGLDCGPMSGFDNAKVDAEFFPDGRVKSNFLCALGHGDPAALPPRAPRLEFEEICQIL